MRAATALRVATSPARLAMRNAPTATGMTMAMKSIAASTSASVKPALAVRERLNGLQFILHTILVQREPHGVGFVGQLQPDPHRAGVGDETIRRKADRRLIASDLGRALPRGGTRERCRG